MNVFKRMQLHLHVSPSFLHGLWFIFTYALKKTWYLSVKERWFYVACKTDGCITCPTTVALQICKAGSSPLLLSEMKDVAIQLSFLELHIGTFYFLNRLKSKMPSIVGPCSLKTH